MKKSMIIAVVLCLSLLLTGCMNMNSDYSFNSDGSCDVTIEMYYADEFLEAAEISAEELFEEMDFDGDIVYGKKTIDGVDYTGATMHAKLSAYEVIEMTQESEDDTSLSFIALGDKTAVEFRIVNSEDMQDVLGSEEEDYEIDPAFGVDPELINSIKIIYSFSFPEGVYSVEGISEDAYVVEGNSVTVDCLADADWVEATIIGILGDLDEELINGSVPFRVFEDVPVDAWYTDALLWALENDVCVGTSETTFSPESTLTCAGMLQFLYNTDGQPEVESDGAYWYSDAQAWAMALGFITDEDIAGITSDCTREQFIDMLYQACLCPTPTIDNPFTDIDSDAVTWAYEMGITIGVGGGRFAPDKTLTRAEAVQFIFNICGE